jgi:hypothetical protein
MPLNLLDREFADLGARLREIDDAAAIDIDGRFPAGGERIGLLRTEVDGFDFEQDAGGGHGRVTVPVTRMPGDLAG